MRPSWDHLYETALGQAGYFTTSQAAMAGYSPQLLQKHLHAGRVTRARRGIYRLVHFPLGDHDELVTAWLWSDRTGVVSHETALSLLELSDVLPAKIHLTLPSEWSRRRFRVPPEVVLHFADLADRERTWLGPVPITNPRRALIDCARSHLSPELLHQAATQAIHRGLVARRELKEIETALRPYGGLAA